jgi:AraC-like DNA-binding protein
MEKQFQENKPVAKTEAVLLEYERRLNIALEYICTNLNGDLSVDAISRAAHFSPFHFHRIFSAR